MRILYLLDRPPGEATFIADEIRAMRRLGVEIHVASLTGATEDVHWISRPAPGAVARHTFGRPLGTAGAVQEALHHVSVSPRQVAHRALSVFRARRVLEILDDLSLDHIHTHHAGGASDVALAVKRMCEHEGRRLVWTMTVHGTGEFYALDRFRVADKVQYADGVVCISYFTRSQVLIATKLAHEQKLELIRCGIDLSRFPYHVGPRESRRVLYVGRFTSVKLVHHLVEAVARVRQIDADVTVRLAGPGAEAFVSALPDRAGWLEAVGPLSPHEVAAEMRSAAVLCLPSAAEALPIVLMEALASGLPVVATSIGGIPELVRGGETGLLVAPTDVDAIAKAIQSTFRDDPAARERALTGRALVESQHDISRNAAELAAFLGGLPRQVWHA